MAIGKFQKVDTGLKGAPELISTIDPETGEVRGKYGEMIEQQALAEGPSTYAQRRLEAQQLEQSGMQDAAAKQAAGAGAAARRAAMMRGGLGGGAAERMAQSQARDTMMAQQRVAGQGAQARAGIMAGDEQQKQKALASLADQSSRQIQDINRAKMAGFTKQKEVESANRMAAAQAQAGSKCFMKDTKIMMADGTYKRIQDIELGDVCMHGGKVYEITSAIGSKIIYDYEGVYVTGSHSVYENKVFVRVEDSEKATPYIRKDDLVVYNISNEEHQILCDNGVLFADDDEVDEGDNITLDESLQLLNKRFHEDMRMIS